MEDARQSHREAYMFEVTDLIGKPFSEMKCWDLVRECRKREGRPIPDYKELMINGVPNEKGYAKKIDTPVEGCICLYALSSENIDHAAYYLGDNKIIHATEGCGVCIERFSRYRSRLKGMYK